MNCMTNEARPSWETMLSIKVGHSKAASSGTSVLGSHSAVSGVM